MPAVNDLPPHDSSLDPFEWSEYRRILHMVCDAVVDLMQDYRTHSWCKPAESTFPSLSLRDDEVRTGLGVPAVAKEMIDKILPYGSGNTHPRFLGWVQGGGNPVAVLAELVAAAMNSNCGGRNHIATAIEREVVAWALRIFGLPSTGSGVLVTGTSEATVLAMAAARVKLLGAASKVSGLHAARPVAAYGSCGAHSAIQKALEVTGFGSDALRLVPVDGATGGMRTDLLESMIENDRRSGVVPFIVVGTAGAVDDGAVDDLMAVADVAERQKVWFHVDGAFGAWLKLASPPLAKCVDGIHRADSLACDFHKWLNVQYDCGMLLMRDERVHRTAFSTKGAYLIPHGEGIAGGAPWFSDYGIELSRGFRALKVWATVRAYGTERLGNTVANSCECAKEMSRLLNESRVLKPYKGVITNVCCFGVRDGIRTPSDTSRANEKVAAVLQATGDPVISTTRLGEVVSLRACFINHRTTMRDVRDAVAACEDAASRISTEV